MYNHCQRERKPPKLRLPPWVLTTMPEDDRATAIGNMHKKIGRSRVWFGRCARRQTLTQTDRQTHTDVLIFLQYLPLLPRQSNHQFSVYACHGLRPDQVANAENAPTLTPLAALVTPLASTQCFKSYHWPA